MSIKNKNLFVILLATFLILAPVMVFADEAPCDSSKQICNPIKANSVIEFVTAILEGVIKIGLPIIALAFVYSGFLFVFARGNEEKLKTAKDALLYSLIGAALLLGAWALAQLISETVIDLGDTSLIIINRYL